MKKYFDVLGIPEGASQEVIQQAYDRLSIELDPAKNNNQEFFIEEYEKLQDAYKALSNSTILQSSEKSYINTNVNEAPQDAVLKQDNDLITITFSSKKIEELKRNAKQNNISIDKPLIFRNLFSFDGRIRRLEYGLSFILWYFYFIMCALILKGSELYYILLIPGFWFLCSQGAKRCHDLNYSGWWQIIPLYELWLIFQESKHGYNIYGPNPKGNN